MQAGQELREAGVQDRRGQLALRVLEVCRNQLFFRHRFLEQALFRLMWAECEDIPFGSDGEFLYYDKKYILERYIEKTEEIQMDVLHTVMHCLYRHLFLVPWDCTQEWEPHWDLAADIAVEWALAELAEAEWGNAEHAKLRNAVMERLKQEAGSLSARKIYEFLRENAREGWRLCGMDFWELSELFRRDDHRLWYKKEGSGQGGNGQGELQQQWKNAADRVLVEAQAFSGSGRGESAGSLIQELKKLTREKYDYTEFLTKFASHREERMQTDEDEFDYVFYTYGLRLFGRVPLVEPLEYREKNLIREFVIAIDTSGSCQGELVERFLQKTCNILWQTESFASRVNIHIIQCDACIQEDAKITSWQALEEYLAHLTLKGFGGTDFKPVFEYVGQLLEAGELTRLDGLLYFTDGYGLFPGRPPRYRTAFVFLDRDEEVRVPAWAMKVYLDKEELYAKGRGA